MDERVISNKHYQDVVSMNMTIAIFMKSQISKIIILNIFKFDIK